MSKINTQQIVDRYDEVLIKLGNMIGQLEDIHSTLDFLSEQTGDNGDPAFMAHDTIESMGKLLGACVTYRFEYAAEIKKAKEGVPAEET